MEKQKKSQTEIEMYFYKVTLRGSASSSTFSSFVAATRVTATAPPPGPPQPMQYEGNRDEDLCDDPLLFDEW